LERRVNPRIGSRIPERVGLGNRNPLNTKHRTSENKQKEKKEGTAPAQNYIYTGLIVFFNKLVWCPYGVPTELEGLCPPTPPHVGVLSVESLHLSVCTAFAFAVDGFAPTFVAVVVVSMTHLIIMGK